MGSEAVRWRTLEPASLIVNLVPDLWRTARNAWPLLLALVVGGSARGIVDLGLILAFFALSVGRTVVHFATLRYRFTEGRLEIQSGLFGRRSRLIDPSRVQNVAIVRNVFHRMAGLVELRIETAGDSGAEGMLSAISEKEAETLRAALAAGQAAAPADAPAEVLARMTVLELVAYGLSVGRVGLALVVTAVLFESFGQLQPGQVERALGSFSTAQMVGLGLAAMAAGYLLSAGSAVLRHHGYTLVRTARGIAAEAGLFTRRRMEVPTRKVQVVRVEEPWLLRWVGYATLQVETAGSPIPGEPAAAEVVVPMVDQEDVGSVLGQLLPRAPWGGPLRPAARRALRRALVGATLRWGLLAGGAVWLGWAWLAPPLLGWGWLSAWLDWRGQGWALTDGYVFARRGFLTRSTDVVPVSKVQSVHRGDGPLLRANRLARVVVRVAGASVMLPDLDAATADEVFAALTEALHR